MKIKRICFWLILAIFIGITIWWMFYFPYSRERLYRAIPSNAIFVSEHPKIAERWKSIAHNPFTLCLMASAGIKQNAVLDPGVDLMLRRFASVNAVIAYVPSLSGSGEPAWVFSSWVGGSGQIFRWSPAGMLAGTNLKKVRIEGGRQIWQIDKKQNPSDVDFSFAIVEGVLLGCISSDPCGVRHLINRIEYSAPIQPDLADQLNIDSSCIKSNQVLDHGYIRWSTATGNDYKVRKFKFSLNVCNENSVDGCLNGGLDLLTSMVNRGAEPTNVPQENVNYSLNNIPVLNNLPLVVGKTPAAIAILPFNLIEPVLSSRRVSRGVRIISKVVGSQTDINSAMFFSVFCGDLSGRILGLKVPSIVTGINVLDETNSIARVSETVDMLNALYRLSVIPRREEIAGRTVVVFDSTRQQGVYDSIAATDKPAITTKEHWLAISSSIGTLTNVVCDPIRIEGTRISPPWVAGIRDVKDCAGYVWIDYESTSEAIKNAIAVYSLVLIAQNADGTAEIRDKLEILQRWIKVLKPVKIAEFKLRCLTPEVELHFKLSSAAK
ncbi:MAG: hypothetical protein PHR77_12355 [Kiritimatiellae bacterium]|nr:hypothetical protein [Kiritimatiellia bacterium]MDD5521343.1 hypothetical protein [Kiritimatiellia bacterium]